MQRITGPARGRLTSLFRAVIRDAAEGNTWSPSYYVREVERRLDDTKLIERFGTDVYPITISSKRGDRSGYEAAVVDRTTFKRVSFDPHLHQDPVTAHVCGDIRTRRFNKA